MKNGIIAIIGVLVVGAGMFVFSRSGPDKASVVNMEVIGDTDMQKEEGLMATDEKSPDAMEDVDASMDGSEAIAGAPAVPGTEAMATVGSYEAYAPEKLAKAAEGDVILFFHAGWCPTCRALDADIAARAGDIPEGVVILKTDYDTETALKKKYGITYQHTMVHVRADGSMIKKWSGSPTLQALLSNI